MNPETISRRLGFLVGCSSSSQSPSAQTATTWNRPQVLSLWPSPIACKLSPAARIDWTALWREEDGACPSRDQARLEPRREPGEASASPTRGTGRWSAKRKGSVVLELLRGADLESLSRRHGVTAAKLSGWREEFLAGGEARLQYRDRAVETEDVRRCSARTCSTSSRPIRRVCARSRGSVRSPALGSTR